MADNNQITYDIDGYDVITTALMELINQYPGLPEGDSFRFNSLNDSKGKALFPTAGAIIERDTKDILGGHEQLCQYPAIIIYRAGGLDEIKRARIKEFLDNLGRWLEKQPININGTTYKLDAYPTLTQGRRFIEIKRTAPAVCNATYENGAEDWAISVTARYFNIF